MQGTERSLELFRLLNGLGPSDAVTAGQIGQDRGRLTAGVRAYPTGRAKGAKASATFS